MSFDRAERPNGNPSGTGASDRMFSDAYSRDDKGRNDNVIVMPPQYVPPETSVGANPSADIRLSPNFSQDVKADNQLPPYIHPNEPVTIIETPSRGQPSTNVNAQGDVRTPTKTS